jgi:hypothetical protein
MKRLAGEVAALDKHGTSTRALAVGAPCGIILVAVVALFDHEHRNRLVLPLRDAQHERRLAG